MALLRRKKKPVIKKRAKRQSVWAVRLKRFGVAVGVLVAVAWVGSWLYLSGSFTRAGNWADGKVLAATAEAGFVARNILVEGREYTDPEVLKALINVQKGDPLFSFNPDEAQELVEQIQWVEAAHVERRLPDTIYIRLQERQPLALYQKDGKLTLIDYKGDVITRHGLERFKNLVVVIGKDAPERAYDLLENLAAESYIYDQTSNVAYIDERRWDIILKGGMRIKLPADDYGLALRKLGRAQAEDGLLDKDLTGIDMRDPEKIVVRTRPGAVQEYKASYRSSEAI